MGFFSDLLPERARDDVPEEEKAVYNPITIFRMMTPVAWAMYISGFMCWTLDAFDFFATSLTLSRLAVQFDKEPHDITTSITLTLLFRSLGAVLFGLAADRWGRKWTLVSNMFIVAALQLGTGFVTDFKSFLAVRSLFGVGMGGIWGQSAATALENVPVQARGLMSGILQQGYACGYLFAACVNLTIVQTDKHHWRVIFWIGSGLSVFAGIVRALLPESQMFIEAREAERLNPNPEKNKNRAFMRELGVMLKTNWIRCIHAILLMTGFNFLSHGSQDLYPTYLEESKGLTAHQASIATIIGNLGAISGGIIAGYLSQFLGRRLVMVAFILLIGAFIPLWILPDGFSKLAAGAFCVQFGVQGAWGVIPVFLNEISPPAFRGTFPGVAYQLGNMVSSAAAQIEATAGDHLRTTVNGKDAPDYAKIQGILIGVVAIYTIILVLLASENLGAHFETAKVGFEEGAGVGFGRDDDLPHADKMAEFEKDQMPKNGEVAHNERMV